jgi:lipoate-protein ligase A
VFAVRNPMTGEQAPVAYPRATWRLIVDGEADGPTNMAIDEAILTAVIEGASPPTLRFYGWSPPCVTLGRSQSLADADQALCLAAGFDLVRRPSGGQAILHTDELTYSVALCQTDPRAEGGVLESYRRLSDGLVAGLHRLGLEAVQAVKNKQPLSEPTPVCFEVPSDYEITAEGRKLVGSAQWRSRGGVLQHGTLPLRGDLTRIVDYLVFTERERAIRRRSLRSRALTLEEATGRILPFSKVAAALGSGMAEALNLHLERGKLSDQERRRASELRRSRYADESWTGRT